MRVAMHKIDATSKYRARDPSLVVVALVMSGSHCWAAQQAGVA